MPVKGKGFMIWKVKSCEGGRPDAIASAAQAAGLSHVWIKIADGPNSYNVDKTTNVDLVPPVVEALRAKKIQVWGWHYIYGNDPDGEAKIAVKRVKNLKLDGYVIDAEVEYKQQGRDEVAKTFMKQLRQGLPSTPVGLCSFRFPNYHRDFPWQPFLERCDYNMPQVYWMEAHNPGEQLRASLTRFQSIAPFRPFLPVGPVFKESGWQPTPEEIVEFMDTARQLGFPAVNFFGWDYGRTILTPLWDAISKYNWNGAQPGKDFPERYIDALNAHDPASVAALYTSQAPHVMPARTIKGTEALRNWYDELLNRTLSVGRFSLINIVRDGNARIFSWQATSPNGNVTNGNDTMIIKSNKISYHFSFFTVKK
jgi:hypothetical protein